MKKDEEDSGIGCVYVGLIFFGITAIKPLLGLVFGVDPNDMVTYDMETDSFHNPVDTLRMGFVILIISIIVFLYGVFNKNK